MGFGDLFILFVMILIIVMYIQNHYSEIEYVVSNVDKRRYLVRKLDDKQDASDYLADLNIEMTKLISHMVAKYPESVDVKQLYTNYHPESISEGSPESGYTSYSINKGDKIVLCIRQTNNVFVDKNVVLYVAIHELAHVMTSEIGHTTVFWNNFKLLLQEAIDIGVYFKVDFSKKPEDYCGIKISSSHI